MNRTSWRIIKNSEEHAAAMERLIELASSDLQPGTEDFDEFERLGLLIEHYESREFPMDKRVPYGQARSHRSNQVPYGSTRPLLCRYETIHWLSI